MPREPSTKEKWGLILKVWVLNILLVPIILLIGSFFSETNHYALIRYAARNYPIYFVDLDRFNIFFWYTLDAALEEEIRFRFPGWIVLFVLTKLKFEIKNYNFAWISVWFTVVVFSILWALGHPSSIAVYSILFAGLTWGWLVVKTGNIWPAIVAHILANTSIYFLIKILLAIGYKI